MELFEGVPSPIWRATLETSPSREGNLAEIGFCEILAELCRNRETGALRLTGGGAEKSVYLQGGNIVFAASRDPDDRLGEMLLTREVIHRRQLEEAALQVGPGKRLGTVLVEMGILPAEDLPRWVREQVKEILFSLFSWTEGMYRFEAGPFPSGEVITLRLSTAEIFLSGLRQVQKWSVLRKGAGEIRLPYRLSQDHQEALREVTLGGEEKKLLSLLQAKPTTMEQAALESGLSTLRVYQLFFAFRVLGVVLPYQAPAQNEKSAARDSLIPGASDGPQITPPSSPPVRAAQPKEKIQAAAPVKVVHSRTPPDPTPREAALPVQISEELNLEIEIGKERARMGTEVGAQTVILKMPGVEQAAVKKDPAAGEPLEAVAQVAPVITDSPAEGKLAKEKAPKGSSSGGPSLTSRPAPAGNKEGAVGTESGAVREISTSSPNTGKRAKADFRVVRVEGERLDGNGAQQIEDLLKQWSGKGYHLAGVVPGKREGLFGSSGSCFFVFVRDHHS
ncbi:MAG: DUF4388 domain-containing protein [Acidobacteria bacterium]|nr:DUF4388 domain-containing protein [Acidobacteriota bacterium]